MTCNASALREHVRLDAIHCVVDAEQLFGAPETMELKLAQMACADMILLNKVDLVRREQIARIRSWLDGRFHRYRLVETVRGEVPMPILLSPRMAGTDDGRGAREAPSDRRRGHGHDAAAQFATWQYETDEPLSLTALRQAASRLPPAIYRAKGVVSAADTPQRCVLHVDVALDGGWRDEAPRTRIVAIGAPGAIDAATLRDLFDRCRAPGSDRLDGRGAT
jgi:G3E family GTPase